MTAYCKFETALDILVGKWKPVILLRLFANGTMRFSELQKAIPDITKKMLTQQLRELEYHDIIHREVYPQVPPKVEYSISAYGQRMASVLQAMNDWGVEHIAHLEELYGKDASITPEESEEYKL
ncbi:winged helix-turn-helix transcriptional regulator [Paenibacillus sacheonensis]|uniref:Transcriptional regulator n=1 Tax=Paenibacillus sacheonensis TaxID=742054 RepID=A0A7X4YR22_9BACL|nr:helix-turn-helix domain-containing protein [Paenibacillus sacheonensis]MBM7567113.1 DNA-binding HxlR family transcriptional regulator [Paenibacillus sacheonensis]NBC70958.1 transcriptional regulator [Paenibacillus sacheonensis]